MDLSDWIVEAVLEDLVDDSVWKSCTRVNSPLNQRKLYRSVAVTPLQSTNPGLFASDAVKMQLRLGDDYE